MPSSLLSRSSARVLPLAAWLCGSGVVLAQILYAVTDPADRLPLTITSVALFCAASLLDAASRFGARAAGLLAVVAGGGGLVAEAVGLRTGVPFGDYGYTGTLGLEVLDVPVVVPMAWVMMAWPSVLVGRALAERVRWGGAAGWTAAPLAAWALASWDVFLDPQMVDAGHWRWADPEPALPGVEGIPLTNFAGWLLVSLLITGALHRLLGPRAERETDLVLGPAPVLYLWTYGSSVWAHAAFFGRPWVSLVGGVLMGLAAVPFARALWRGRR